jgi:hypothetical protein
VAFAGTVVRGMGKQSMLGNWASALLRKTCWMALLGMVLLAGFAHTMQNAAPQTDTIAQAYKPRKGSCPYQNPCKAKPAKGLRESETLTQ